LVGAFLCVSCLQGDLGLDATRHGPPPPAHPRPIAHGDLKPQKRGSDLQPPIASRHGQFGRVRHGLLWTQVLERPFVYRAGAGARLFGSRPGGTGGRVDVASGRWPADDAALLALDASLDAWALGVVAPLSSRRGPQPLFKRDNDDDHAADQPFPRARDAFARRLGARRRGTFELSSRATAALQARRRRRLAPFLLGAGSDRGTEDERCGAASQIPRRVRLRGKGLLQRDPPPSAGPWTPQLDPRLFLTGDRAAALGRRLEAKQETRRGPSWTALCR
jgi:hypothetical protein